MNLRFTKVKVILTLIFTIGIYILSNFVFSSSKGFDNILKIFTISTSTDSILTFLITIFVVYLILSIFHRRKMPALPSIRK
jgi:hypothetical protein